MLDLQDKAEVKEQVKLGWELGDVVRCMEVDGKKGQGWRPYRQFVVDKIVSTPYGPVLFPCRGGGVYASAVVKSDCEAEYNNPAILRLQTIAEFHFGEERVDFSKERMIIHYPELTIVNSENWSHDIKDLYVKVNIAASRHTLCLPYGARTTLTDYEAFFGFRHPHLVTETTNRFSSFCTGTGNINKMTSRASSALYKLRTADIDEQDVITLELYLASLTAYVSWESLEGVPYFGLARLESRKNTAIENIKNRSNSKDLKTGWDIVEISDSSGNRRDYSSPKYNDGLWGRLADEFILENHISIRWNTKGIEDIELSEELEHTIVKRMYVDRVSNYRNYNQLELKVLYKDRIYKLLYNTNNVPPRFDYDNFLDSGNRFKEVSRTPMMFFKGKHIANKIITTMDNPESVEEKEEDTISVYALLAQGKILLNEGNFMNIKKYLKDSIYVSIYKAEQAANTNVSNQ